MAIPTTLPAMSASWIAAEFDPCSASGDISSTRTETIGMIRPMPAPDSVQIGIAIQDLNHDWALHLDDPAVAVAETPGALF